MLKNVSESKKIKFSSDYIINVSGVFEALIVTRDKKVRLNRNEYGAHRNNRDWIYKIPVTRKALLSILTGSAYKYLNLSLNPEFYVDVNVIAYIEREEGCFIILLARKNVKISK